MSTDVIHFEWRFSEAGYEWAKGKTPATDKYGLFLVPQGIALSSNVPLAHSGLFRDFAATEPTKDAILNFANTYGSLGGRGNSKNCYLDDGRTGRGEPIELWKTEILSMKRAVKLWDMVQTQDLEGLVSQRVGLPEVEKYRVEPDMWPIRPPLTDVTLSAGTVQIVNDAASAPRSSRRPTRGPTYLPPPSRSWPSSRRITTPALSEVQSITNTHIEGRLSPTLAWDRRSECLRLFLIPDGLIGALWLQFAQAINRNKTYRQCLQCNRWFEISPQTARDSRRYCSNACRSKAYRERRETARRLHAQGGSLKEIARKLGTDSKTLDKWLNRAPAPDRNSGDTD